MAQQELSEEERKKIAARLKEQEDQAKILGGRSEEQVSKDTEETRKKPLEPKPVSKKAVKAERVPQEGDKDFVGPIYTGLINRPGGKKFRAEKIKLEKKIMLGTATDEEKHRYFIVSGTRAKDVETD